MIIGIIHKGSGLGDQLFSYIATRVRAVDLGVDFGFVGKEFFKGSFMDLDWGKEIDLKYHIEEPAGKLVIDDEPILKHTGEPSGFYVGYKLFEINKPYYDPEFNFIEDGTVIDGYGAQDERYFSHKLGEIRRWLKVEPLFVHPDKCIINFRGGEFGAVPELFLPQKYWQEAIERIQRENEFVKFEVHTDDPSLAKQFFPDFECIRDISLNWRSVRYAKYLILSNSAFGIIPSLLNEEAKTIIAPRYWARRNIQQWSLPSNYYKKFTYV